MSITSTDDESIADCLKPSVITTIIVEKCVCVVKNESSKPISYIYIYIYKGCGKMHHPS